MEYSFIKCVSKGHKNIHMHKSNYDNKKNNVIKNLLDFIVVLHLLVKLHFAGEMHRFSLGGMFAAAALGL